MTKSHEKVRVGIIGAGGIANDVHLPSLRDIEGAEMVAVCDVIAERAERASAGYGIPATYTLYQEMLDRESLDAAFVLTEPDQLFRPAVRCLRAGLHVFMEKPPGVTTFQAESLSREAAGAERICQVGLNRRHVPVVARVLELLRQHTPITQVDVQFNKHTSASFCEGSVSAFESDVIHVVDLVRWIAGGEPADAATVEEHFQDVVPNRWNSVIRFDSGVTGTVRANYMAGGRIHNLELHGPGGSARVELGTGKARCGAEVLLHDGQQRIRLDGREVAGGDDFHVYYGYLQEDREFIDCVRAGRQPDVTIDEAVKDMKLIDLLRASRI